MKRFKMALAGVLALATLAGCGGPMVTPPASDPTPQATPQPTPDPTPQPPALDVEGEMLPLARAGQLGWALLYGLRQHADDAEYKYLVRATRPAVDEYGTYPYFEEIKIPTEDPYYYDMQYPCMEKGPMMERWTEQSRQKQGVAIWRDSSLTEQQKREALQKLHQPEIDRAQAFARELETVGKQIGDPMVVAHEVGMRVYPVVGQVEMDEAGNLIDTDGLRWKGAEILPVDKTWAFGEVTAAQLQQLLQAGLICKAVARRTIPRAEGWPEAYVKNRFIQYWDDALVYMLEQSRITGESVPVWLTCEVPDVTRAEAEALYTQIKDYLVRECKADPDRFTFVYDEQENRAEILNREILSWDPDKAGTSNLDITYKDALWLLQVCPDIKLQLNPTCMWSQDLDMVMAWNYDFVADNYYCLCLDAGVYGTFYGGGRMWEIGLYKVYYNHDPMGFWAVVPPAEVRMY
nr:hypothetical protein [bacterium]